MPKLKKTIFLLDIDGYEPEVKAITYPLIERYAEKIDAEIFKIEKRAFEGFPITYEKLQIYELGNVLGNDWNIYIDSDALVHPSAIDFTELIDKDVVLQYGGDMALIRWKYDEFFQRDGRNIGSCNWFTIASDWCLDLWKPLDNGVSLEKVLGCIYPTQYELSMDMERGHLIDDYVLSRNIAQFGLHYKSIGNLIGYEQLQQADFLWHKYAISTEDKIEQMKQKLKEWHL